MCYEETLYFHTPSLKQCYLFDFLIYGETLFCCSLENYNNFLHGLGKFRDVACHGRSKFAALY